MVICIQDVCPVTGLPLISNTVKPALFMNMKTYLEASLNKLYSWHFKMSKIFQSAL